MQSPARDRGTRRPLPRPRGAASARRVAHRLVGVAVNGDDSPSGPALIQPLEDAKGGQAAGWIEIREPDVVCELGARLLSEAFREEHPSRLKARPRVVGVGLGHPKRLGRVRAGPSRRAASEHGELGVGLQVERLRPQDPLQPFAGHGLVAGTMLQAGEEHERDENLRRASARRRSPTSRTLRAREGTTHRCYVAATPGAFRRK